MSEPTKTTSASKGRSRSTEASQPPISPSPTQASAPPPPATQASKDFEANASYILSLPDTEFRAYYGLDDDDKLPELSDGLDDYDDLEPPGTLDSSDTASILAFNNEFNDEFDSANHPSSAIRDLSRDISPEDESAYLEWVQSQPALPHSVTTTLSSTLTPTPSLEDIEITKPKRAYNPGLSKGGMRVPPPHEGINVNFCKNPSCANYGVPAKETKVRATPGKTLSPEEVDNYTISGTGTGGGNPAIGCALCKEYPPIKSNLGVWEEYIRLSAFLTSPTLSGCPDPECVNHDKPYTDKQAFKANGKTPTGSQRYLCKAPDCGKTFSVGGSTLKRQKSSHKNALIFRLLVNKMPLRRICEVAGVSMRVLYQRIDFIHRQCLAFVADRERALMEGRLLIGKNKKDLETAWSGRPAFKRLYLGSDRQVFTINWNDTTDKRTINLMGAGTADNDSSYVFAMTLNYDPALNHADVEIEAEALGDAEKAPPFRRYARVWLETDYAKSITKSTKRMSALTDNLRKAKDLKDEIAGTYNDYELRDDIESSDLADTDIRLPKSGMQVKEDYALYGHFFYLQKLLGKVEKLRFYMDQDAGIRAACLSAFCQEVKDRRVDAFFLRTNRNLTKAKKRTLVQQSKQNLKEHQAEHPELGFHELELLILKERIAEMAEIGKWKDKWLMHPFPTMNEAEKAVCYLTDRGDYDEDHLARLYQMASCRAVNRFFMLIRRRLSMLERPIGSASTESRKWYGYAPYKPENVVKLLDIFRVYYNYCFLPADEVDTDGKTPAMRLGLAKAVLDVQDIIYFRG